MVRFGSARYAVPSELVGQVSRCGPRRSVVIITQGDVEIIRHQPVGPGEVALGPFADEARRPTRGVRPRTATELAFLGLGGVAEAFLRAAAAAGTLRLEAELAGIVALDVAWGREALIAARWSARRRYRRFTRRRRAGHPGGRAGCPGRRGPAQPLALDLPGPSRARTPGAPTRASVARMTGMTATAPPLAAPTWWPGSNGCSSPTSARSPPRRSRPPRPSAGRPRRCCARSSRPRSPGATPPTWPPG